MNSLKKQAWLLIALIALASQLAIRSEALADDSRAIYSWTSVGALGATAASAGIATLAAGGVGGVLLVTTGGAAAVGATIAIQGLQEDQAVAIRHLQEGAMECVMAEDCSDPTPDLESALQSVRTQFAQTPGAEAYATLSNLELAHLIIQAEVR